MSRISKSGQQWGIRMQNTNSNPSALIWRNRSLGLVPMLQDGKTYMRTNSFKPITTPRFAHRMLHLGLYFIL